MKVVTVIAAWNKGSVLTERSIADAKAYCDYCG